MFSQHKKPKSSLIRKKLKESISELILIENIKKMEINQGNKIKMILTLPYLLEICHLF